MDNIVEALNNAYQDFVAAAALIYQNSDRNSPSVSGYVGPKKQFC